MLKRGLVEQLKDCEKGVLTVAHPRKPFQGAQTVCALDKSLALEILNW